MAYAQHAQEYFYSRPCGRGDTGFTALYGMPQSFLLTPLREGRRRGLNPCDVGVCISTHAPAGGATMSATGSCMLTLFLLTPLREGRLLGSTAANNETLFLLTPLREGRRKPCGKGGFECQISTHAPAGGATPIRAASSQCAAHFYSRPCGRGDLSVFCDGVDLVHISTHAPAGGATSVISPSPQASCYFYSRPCGRGDGWLHAARRYHLHFYSRPCGRGDGSGGMTCMYESISTHAPAGGATSGS